MDEEVLKLYCLVVAMIEQIDKVQDINSAYKGKLKTKIVQCKIAIQTFANRVGVAYQDNEDALAALNELQTEFIKHIDNFIIE